MAFTIKSPPEFTTDLTQWDRETLADGSEMAKEIEKLLNNTVYNKALGEQLRGKIIKGVSISKDDWSELSYTVADEVFRAESTVYIGYAYESIPAAQKANIRGRTVDGQLIFTAKKAPTEDLLIDEIRIVNLREG